MILLKNITTLVLAPILIMMLLIISSYTDEVKVKRVALEDITDTSVVVMSSEVESIEGKSKSATFEATELEIKEPTLEKDITVPAFAGMTEDEMGISQLLIATVALHNTVRDYKK